MRHRLFFLFLFFSRVLLAQDVDEQEALYFELIDSARAYVFSGADGNAWQKTLQAAAVWEQDDPVFGYLQAFEETASFYISREAQERKGRKDYKTAAKYFAFALEIFSNDFNKYEPEEAEYLADINAMLGNAYKKSSRILEAKAAYQKAFAGYRHLDSLTYDYDKRWVAVYVYKPLANIYTRLENYENATSLLLLAQSILEKVGKKGESAQVAIDLGILYATTERHQKAVDLFSKHYDNPNLSVYIKSVLLLNRARSLMKLSQKEAALNDVNAAINLLQAEKWPGVLIDAYHILGQLQSKLGNATEAKMSFEYAINLGRQVLPSKSRKLSKIYVSLGLFYLQTDQPQTALIAFQKSLYAVLENVDSTAILTIPDDKDLYAENAILTALDGKATAFEKLFQNSGKPEDMVNALENLQAGFEVERLLQNTQQHSTSKIQFQSQNQSRRERAIRICDVLHQKTGDIRYIELAFQIAEASKAAVLLGSVREILARRQLGDSQPLLIKIIETEKVLAEIKSELLASDSQNKEDFNQLNEQKVFLSQNLLALKQKLQELHPEFANLTVKGEILTVDDVQEKLLQKKEEVFVEFFWGSEYLYIFKIEKETGISFFRINQEQGLQMVITQFLNLFSAERRWNMSAGSFQSASYNLYQKIFYPLQLQAFSKIIIIPDGLLSFIPFEALVIEKKKAAFFKNLDYLVKTQNIQYAYSGSVLKQQQKNKPSGKIFLFVAPGFAGSQQGLPPLDASVLDIGRPSGLKKLSNEEATRMNFEKHASLSRIIHLFTHAEANQNGQQPRVYFYDKSLPLPEIYALNLSAELVVLSACETNLGKLEKGEGVMSLARGFAYAGASSLIASLWKVKNQQTAQVFTSFYKNLSSGKSTSVALRQAKLSYLGQTDDIHASPAYWAGFVFIGSDKKQEKPGINIWLFSGLGLLVVGIMLFFRRRTK